MNIERPDPPTPERTAAAPLRTDTLAEGVIILLALAVVQRVVGFGRAILFCRWLSPEELGQWDMAFAFLVLAAPLVVMALPGTFGRYVERFRQRGQLRGFLRRTGLTCAALAVPAVAAIFLARTWFSQLIFGTREQADLVVLLAGGLVAVLAFNFHVELFTALRNVRLVAGMQLANALLFATLGAGLMLGWRCTASSVVVAYVGACALTSAGALWYLRRAWPAMSDGTAASPRGSLWTKLAPYASWLLLVSLMANLFDVADRYMIVHFSQRPAAEALTLVGDYHSSRVAPLLLVSIAGMLAPMIMPHLSHDWEAGRRRRVSDRLNLFVKLLAFALTAAAVAVALGAPLLFSVAFDGKFAGGRVVFPWTLTYCVWFGVALVAQTYLWCAEKGYLVSVALAAGLMVNVGLNLLLLPRMGLLGAVVATTAANLVALALILCFGRLLGFRLDRGTLVVLGIPFAICLGPWIALLVLAAVALDAAASERVLSADEKRQLADGWRHYRRQLATWWPARSAAQRQS